VLPTNTFLHFFQVLAIFGGPPTISWYFPEYSHINIPLSFFALYALNFLYTGKLRKQMKLSKNTQRQNINQILMHHLIFNFSFIVSFLEGCSPSSSVELSGVLINNIFNVTAVEKIEIHFSGRKKELKRIRE